MQRNNLYLIFCILIAPTINGDVSPLKQRADQCAAQEQFEEAIALYTDYYSNHPYDIQALFNTALCLLKIGKITQAISLFESLLPLAHNTASIKYNIAYAYKVAGMLDTAIPLYEALIAEDPDHNDAHLALGFAYLQKGDFARGWQQHSRYLKRANKNGDALRTALATNTIAGKKIVLHYEGGLGDTVLFVRYAQKLKNLGAEITCLVQKPLMPLLSRCPYIDRLEPYRQPLPEYDAIATLMSLPAIFGDTEENFPVSIPYIYPDPTLVTEWHEQLKGHDGIKVGITWQSDVHNDVSRLPIARRGIPLALFEPLLKDPRFTFISLQCFEGTEQITQLSPACRLITYEDFDTEHGAFMDSAALIPNLDLVIAVDSAVANISGALGVPTLLLLPYVTDWRWIAGRTDSPWYPQHHIFKQPHPFDWATVVTEVTQYLESYYLQKKDRL
jgi:tetratricopeptide (TPR) repeat protein